MTLVLAIDTASRTYAVTLGTGDRPAAARSGRRQDPGFAGLGGLTAQALSDAGAAFADIAAIGVDVGPGGLSSIRAAVAYANGLAFSLGVRVLPVSSLELMAIAAGAGPEGPVLSLKVGQAGHVYAGLYVNGAVTGLRHGPPAEVIPAVVGPLGRVTLVGALDSAAVSPWLPGVTVDDTGITDADVTVLYAQTRAALATPDRLVTAATPLNEASRVFHEAAPR